MQQDEHEQPAWPGCDDGCGKPASLVVCDVGGRDVDLLCWPCLMRRALEVAAAVTQEAPDG